MNDIMNYKDYSGSVEYSDADKVYYGKVLGIRSLVSYEGSGRNDLKTDFEEAVDDYFDLCARKGIEPEKPYNGIFTVSISPELHRQLAAFSDRNNQSLDVSVEKAIKKLLS